MVRVKGRGSVGNSVILPWFPKECSPNARVHHMVLARAKASYMDLCFQETKAQKMQAPDFKPMVHVEFYPPNKRRRDLDNCLASLKAGIDGMAKAIGIDDCHFTEYRLFMKSGSHVRGKGYVVVTLLSQEA